MGIRSRTPLRAAWLLAIVAGPALAQPSTWTPLGPAPATNGQVEGITDRPIAGAIHALAPHPTDASILYVGAVNGGVWKSTNATAAAPSWTRLTDAELSNAIGDLTFDTTDATNDTLVAGVARYSSFGSRGGRRIGVLRTTDGGTTWTALTNNMDGRNVSGVVARDSTIVASVDIADSFTCANIGIFRSTDTGASFAKLGVTAGLPDGAVDALAADPSNPAILYASVALAGTCSGNAALNGIYKSTDTGATWAKVSTAAMDSLFHATNSSGDNVRFATAPGGVVVVAIARGTLLGVFHSTDGGSNWTSMGLPSTLEGATQVGIHPGGQGSLHLSLAVDPGNTNIVYVGGDRQPLSGAGSFPNSSGAMDFSGRLFRGDVTLPAATQWTQLTHVGAAGSSSPHADSREMTFDASGRLLEADDGGIYARLMPQSATGAWISLNGDLQVNEQHSAVRDPVSNVVLSGNQDTGTTRQVTPASRVWLSLHTGDGGDVETDALFLAPQNQSIGYASFQNLGTFRRRVQTASNVLVSSTNPALTVTSGPAFAAQFTTPVAANQVAGGRLIFGGANSAYESLNRGDSRAEVPSGDPGFGIKTAANGADNIGYGAADNANALYVGGCRTDQSTAATGYPCLFGTTGVYRRLVAGGALTRVYTARAGNSTIHGVTLDADDSAHVFAVETATTVAPILAPRVLRSTDSGANWTDATGNLPSSVGAIRSILYVPHATNDLLVVGTEAGVHVTSRERGFTAWTPLGTALPIVPVFDLSYDPGDDVLHAGTLGRGSFALVGVAAAPVTVADSAATLPAVPVVVDVLANDSDVGGALDAATVTLSSPALNGATSIDPGTGAITYTPSAAFSGNEVLAYRVRDDLGTLSNVSLVTIRVNASPVAAADSVVAQPDTPLTITVLANDSDPDGTLDVASVAIVAQPSSGTASVAPTGVVTFTPAPAFIGTVTFTYTVRDNDAVLSNVATVAVRVNAAPAAVDDAVIAQRDTALPIAVLANDTDDDTLAADSVAITTPPASGTTSVADTGIVTYTPAAGSTATVTFAYTVEDSDGVVSSPATVTVTVNAPPAALDDTIAIDTGATATTLVGGATSLLANDTDPDAEPLVVTTTPATAPQRGTLTLAADGTFSYVHDGSPQGADEFTYSACDGRGGCTTARVGIQVGDLIHRDGFED